MGTLAAPDGVRNRVISLLNQIMCMKKMHLKIDVGVIAVVQFVFLLSEFFDT